MTTESIINQIKLLPAKELPEVYECVCEEYRRRLCEQWNYRYNEAWWHGDKIGEGLFLGDWWLPLDIQELRYVVDHNVTEDAWLEYCAFVESEINNEQERPRINFSSWFRFGARPKDLEK